MNLRWSTSLNDGNSLSESTNRYICDFEHYKNIHYCFQGLNNKMNQYLIVSTCKESKGITPNKIPGVNNGHRVFFVAHNKWPYPVNEFFKCDWHFQSWIQVLLQSLKLQILIKLKQKLTFVRTKATFLILSLHTFSMTLYVPCLCYIDA